MTSQSPSTPSEGEIVESDSEKATTSLPSVNGNSVDPRSRNRFSVSQSTSPITSPRSPRRRRSRTRSRSPYRKSRGTKRPREEDLYDTNPRNEPRRFKVHYEDMASSGRRRSHGRYSELDQRRDTRHGAHHDTHTRPLAARPHTQKTRTRTRSPIPMRRPPDSEGIGRRGFGRWDEGRKDLQGQGRSGRSFERFSKEQSVSDRGQSSGSIAFTKPDAETSTHQKQQQNWSRSDVGDAANSSGKAVVNDVQKPTEATNIDDATLIEQRRKRREAIKAKYRDQAAPVLVQNLTIGNQPVSVISEFENGLAIQPTLGTSLQASPPQTPADHSGQETPPPTFTALNDEDIANSKIDNDCKFEDEPSAADYDPTMDMEEDKLRHDKRQYVEDVSSGAYDETKNNNQAILLPNVTGETAPSKIVGGGFDMFADADEDDMFAEEIPNAPAERIDKDDVAKAVAVPQAKALDMGMLDDWDDSEGYYKVILGELINDRYHVQSNLGKGMFSGVVRAMDQDPASKRLVAIKIIRNNETMKKAGLKEIEILQLLMQNDPEDKKHMIRLVRHFEHKGHLCMVFENLSINLREVLRKFGRDVGITLRAVRIYAQQMFLGLSLLRRCNVLHADLKPDNVLVNETRTLLKICDLGSASDASENEITPYLVSRFYRAPEIILGMPYDYAIDMWSIGCTLFELYTGKILFTGRTNNQMLRSIMECRGKFSHKVLRKAQFAGLHFDDLLNFRSVEKDKLTGKDVVRIFNFAKPTRDLRTRLLANAKGMNDADIKELNLFIDLLERCLNLNPEKRCTPPEALKHPFIQRATK